jgi:hypothetical protein
MIVQLLNNTNFASRSNHEERFKPKKQCVRAPNAHRHEIGNSTMRRSLVEKKGINDCKNDWVLSRRGQKRL